MAFSHSIAHRITRNAPLSAINSKISADELPPSGKRDEILYDIKTQFIRKGGKSYGKFSHDTSEHPFSAWLQEYRQERLNFTSFTQKSVNHLKIELEKTELLFDIYLLFAIEKIEAGEFLSIYILEHMSGLYFDGDIALSDSIFIDTNGFRLAAKIHLQEWESGESGTYLTLLRTRTEKELADAFTHLIGFSDKHDIKSDTVEFLNAAEEFTHTLDEATARVTRTKIVDYCLEQNKAGKPVIIKELSANLSHEIKNYEPERFSDFVSSKQSEVKNEFIPDSNQVRHYIRISGRNDSLSMSFASECLGSDILYDPNSDSLTIKNIPPALKARLLKHLKNSDQ